MGVLNMSVRNAGGIGTRIKAPTAVSVAAADGPAAGGTAVVVTGTNFKPGATLTFGGVAATGISVTGKTTIACTTPAHAAGAVNVIVTNHDGNEQSGTGVGIFTYT